MTDERRAMLRRWLSLSAVLERNLDRPLGPADRVEPGDLVDAMERLQCPLPKALCEFLLIAGRRADLVGQRDRWVPIETVQLFDGLLVLIEGDTVDWGIEALAEDDPPVVLWSEGTTTEIGQTLSEFLTDRVRTTLENPVAVLMDLAAAHAGERPPE